jgi:hypothetical protein
VDLLLSAKSNDAFLISHNIFLAANQAAGFNHVLCKEVFTTMSIVMYFRKDLYLQPAIDETISKFQAGGLIEHWHMNSIYGLQRSLKVGSNEPRKMTINHLLGCFEVWAFGMVLGLGCFLIEKLFRIVESVRKVWKNVKQLELRAP